MEFVVNGKIKELIVVGNSGIEHTEYFMDLVDLINRGEVWEDDKENFCMSEDTYDWWKLVCDMQTDVMHMEHLLTAEDFSAYNVYLDELIGYDMDDRIARQRDWLILKTRHRGGVLT